jgi:uncharacterized protein YPO0396
MESFDPEKILKHHLDKNDPSDLPEDINRDDSLKEEISIGEINNNKDLIEEETEFTRPLDKYTGKLIRLDQRLKELKNKIKDIDNQNIDFERMKNTNSERKNIILDSSLSNTQIFESAVKEYEELVTNLEQKIQNGKTEIVSLLREVSKTMDAKDRVEAILDAGYKEGMPNLN